MSAEVAQGTEGWCTVDDVLDLIPNFADAIRSGKHKVTPDHVAQYIKRRSVEMTGVARNQGVTFPATLAAGETEARVHLRRINSDGALLDTLRALSRGAVGSQAEAITAARQDWRAGIDSIRNGDWDFEDGFESHKETSTGTGASTELETDTDDADYDVTIDTEW